MNTQNKLLRARVMQREPKWGVRTIKKVIDEFGSLNAVFDTPIELWQGAKEPIRAIRHKAKNNLLKQEVAQELAYMQRLGISAVFYPEADYPELLKHCVDAPAVLFMRGKLDLNHKPLISIVGTRRATRQGVAFCEQIIEELAPISPTIISGFAYGMDISAHKKAMVLGLQSIGCLAHGLNTIYPRAHHKYMGGMQQHGGFISEFWTSDPFYKSNFLQRNRIIAGLSTVTIVIESAAKGGSLITAKMANAYDREVFAVPGAPADQQSAGCNELIRTHQAHLLTGSKALCEVMGWELIQPKKEQLPSDDIERKLLQLMLKEPRISQNDLQIKMSVSISQLQVLLLNLELSGMITRDLLGGYTANSRGFHGL